MSNNLEEVCRIVETLWPLAGAETWDASGLVSGSSSANVERILLVVDTVRATVDEAIERGASLVISHHPLLLRGVKSIAEDHYKGALLASLIRHDCALLSAHTNADVVADGTSAVMARALGLVDTRPIVSTLSRDIGLGRVGFLAEPTTLGALARRLATLIPATAGGVRAAGHYDQRVNRVAVCAGAGDSLLADPVVREADVYITADLRHHPASEAREQALNTSGPALLDVSHWASEWLWLNTAATALRALLPDVVIEVSEIRTDPWDFVILQ